MPARVTSAKVRVSPTKAPEKREYVKDNKKQVKKIETQVQRNIREGQEKAAALQQLKAQTVKGAIPKYLQERKAEAELERQET